MKDGTIGVCVFENIIVVIVVVKTGVDVGKLNLLR